MQCNNVTAQCDTVVTFLSKVLYEADFCVECSAGWVLGAHGGILVQGRAVGTLGDRS